MKNDKQEINKSLLSSKFEDQYRASKALKDSILSHFDHSKYSIMDEASYQQIFACEFIAVVLFTFGFTSAVSSEQIDAQAAASILISIFIMTPFCGANLNPMVTLSNCIKKENKYRWNKFATYTAGQVLGAITGLLWSEFIGRALLPELILNDWRDTLRVISNEAMGVFIFIFFLMMLSNPNTTFIQNQLTGYLSIAIFYHIARSFAPFAGLAINPAVSIALCTQYASKGNWTSLSNCYAWLLGDLIGCILATYFYDKLYQPIVVNLRQIRRRSQNFQSVTDESGTNSETFIRY